MGSMVKMAFEAKSIFVPLGDILPLKHLPPTIKNSRKYQQIAASLREIGCVEPPVVTQAKGRKRQYLLLDGHLRILALKDLNVDGVVCLLSTDDEAFTYNKRVNRLATVQEHKMILKAIKQGVPETRIAKALDVDVHSIRRKRRLLDGICPEAAELLKDKHCPINTFQTLKKMKPMRQVEVAELMILVNNYSISYAKALLAGTPQDQLVESQKPNSVKEMSPEQMARMEKEMANLQRKLMSIEQSYGPDHLNLVLARGYLASLLENARIVPYLSQHHPEILTGFQKIVEVTSIGADEGE